MSMGNATEPSGAQRRRDGALPPAKVPVLESPLLRFAPWAVATALALAVTWLAFRGHSLRAENESLLTERRLADVAYRTAQNRLAERSLLAEGMINDLGKRLHRSADLARLKVVGLASPAGSTTGTQAIAVWDPDQQTGLLTFDRKLPDATGQDYQIWIVDQASLNPVNGGVLHITTDGPATLVFKPDQPVKQATAFTISLERKGGVAKAEGPVVMFGKLLAP